MFEPVTLKWKGIEYKIPADGVLRAIADIEEVLTLGEMSNYTMKRQCIPLGKLSFAYSKVLQHAGVQVTADEVYQGLFADGNLQATAMQAMLLLQVLMIPPEHLRDPKPAGEGEKKVPAAGRTRSVRRKLNRNRPAG